MRTFTSFTQSCIFLQIQLPQVEETYYHSKIELMGFSQTSCGLLCSSINGTIEGEGNNEESSAELVIRRFQDCRIFFVPSTANGGLTD